MAGHHKKFTEGNYLAASMIRMQLSVVHITVAFVDLEEHELAIGAPNRGKKVFLWLLLSCHCTSTPSSPPEYRKFPSGLKHRVYSGRACQ